MEASVSVFLLDTSERDCDLDIEEFRTYTVDDYVNLSTLRTSLLAEFRQYLIRTSDPDYVESVMANLEIGKEDFNVDWCDGTSTRVVTVWNTPATSYVVNGPAIRSGTKVSA